MMNHGIKSAFFAGAQPPPCCLRSIAFFHSTPSLERRRGTQWNYRNNYYAKRMNRIESKRTLLRNVSDYAEYLFQSWRDEDDLNGFPSNDDTAWFRRQYWSKGAKVNGFNSNEFHSGKHRNRRKGGFGFGRSDDDVETIFRSAFGGEGYYYWSFDSSENFQWRNPTGRANHTSSWDWRYETDEEVDCPPQSDLASERLALGLKASGPLQLEEVKKAYRACALQWHPDRHQGSSKAVAEEKFKHCSAAYKSLCEKLAVE